MKKFLFFALIGIITMSCNQQEPQPPREIIAQGYCGAQGNNLRWALTADGVLTISGNGKMMNYDVEANVAPWRSFRDVITTFVIENGITTIGTHAFCSTPLTYSCNTATIRNSATEPIDSIIIPNSVTEIGDWAFSSNTSLIFVSIPNSVTIIGESAFLETGLTSVTIPSSVTSIGRGAFAVCVNLTSIDVAPDNPAFSSENGVLFNKDKTILIQFPAGKEGAYIIPDGVAVIEDGAFG